MKLKQELHNALSEYNFALYFHLLDTYKNQIRKDVITMYSESRKEYMFKTINTEVFKQRLSTFISFVHDRNIKEDDLKFVNIYDLQIEKNKILYLFEVTQSRSLIKALGIRVEEINEILNINPLNL